MKKILIVEDDDALRMLYETEIGGMGYEVILAKDGEEAVEFVKIQTPDLVVLDLMMPRKHGLEALREILSSDPTTPVIINTAYTHYKDDFISWAAEQYIVKSSDLSELKNAIKRILP